MGSNQSKVIESIDIASFDDSAVREYLIDLVNDNPESFEDYEDHKVI